MVIIITKCFYIYLAGKFNGGIAPNAMITLPAVYTIDRYKIVLEDFFFFIYWLIANIAVYMDIYLNRPSQLSAMIAPKMGKK